MIETLNITVENIQAILGILSVPAFVMVVTALLKKRLLAYTPYIAVTIGVVIGVIATVVIGGVNILGIIAGVIYGALSGASAVGIKVIADGEPDEVEFSELH